MKPLSPSRPLSRTRHSRTVKLAPEGAFSMVIARSRREQRLALNWEQGQVRRDFRVLDG